MVQAEGVEVFLTRHRDGVRYRELLVPPTSKVYTGDPNEVYIEAVTDERFCINVGISKTFDFKGSPHARIINSVDGGTDKCRYVPAPGVSAKTLGAAKMSLGRTQVIGTEKLLVDGTWMEYGFEFGSLECDMEMWLGADEVKDGINRHGKVTVTVTRGRRQKKKAKISTERSSIDFLPSSKQIVKDGQVSHAVRHIPIGAAEAQKSTGKFQAAEGSPGHPIVFTIRYRSEMSLRVSGILTDDNNGTPPADSQPAPEDPNQGTKVDTPVAAAEETGASEAVHGVRTQEPATSTRPTNEPEAGNAGNDEASRARKRRRLQLELKRIEIEQQLLGLEEE